MVSAYLPPTTNLQPADLDAIFSTQDAVILAGDLNCKHPSWNNVTRNKNGNSLLSYCLNNNISINYPDQPTHFPYNSFPSVLDIALSQRCTISKPLTLLALSSDHDPIVFKVHLRPVLRSPTPSYNYKLANWPLYRSSIDFSLVPLPPILTTTELDQAITAFSRSIQQAAKLAIPMHSSRRNPLTLPPPYSTF